MFAAALLPLLCLLLGCGGGTLGPTSASSTFGISGTINGSGGNGAAVALTGVSSATSVANASGSYRFTGLNGGTYAVTPGNSGFVFNPSTQTVTLTSASATGVDFAASVAPPTYSISGVITPSANGSGAGATLTLSGVTSATTTADPSSGKYTFSGLVNGAYTVTPSATGAVFNPTSQSITISGSSNTAVNFAAAALFFYDDFTSSMLSPLWTAENRHGDYSNTELQCYLPANVALSAGFLNITSQVQTQVCGDANHAAAQWNYTSGMVQWTSLNFTYGTVEVRAKMPGGAGTWPAIWMLGLNCQAVTITGADNIGTCNWPQPGSDEIDITEIINSKYGTVNQEIHTGGPSNGPPLHNDGCTPSTTDTSQNYHVYQLVWQAGSVVWKIDGATTCTVTQSYVPSTAMFLIINTAMGGAGGPVTNSTLPETMNVDYVKVTQP